MDRMMQIADLHMHIVPDFDDGASNLNESLAMLKIAYNQGVRNVFCTSHNGYSKDDGQKYQAKFQMLQILAKSKFPDLTLHSGCEVLCAAEYMNDIIYGLEIGAFATLGDSKCVLTELYSDTKTDEVWIIADTFIKNGYTPIFAHFERYYNLTEKSVIDSLIKSGCFIQVNAYSFCEETDNDYKNRARALLKNQQMHFIGSDAHGLDYRPPNYTSGVQHIFDTVSKEYANEILWRNAEQILFQK